MEHLKTGYFKTIEEYKRCVEVCLLDSPFFFSTIPLLYVVVIAVVVTWDNSASEATLREGFWFRRNLAA